ncbi:DUF1150 family protein [Phaeovulum vinaykumarii]|uniref:DUF1150 family protein n=1 Tax=Phaeovulum vinaykumarii TaxID=407234 RepID=A0A1N7MFG9_9RHOB|nr:DUF1150 family protein [Phaeovulum vinaykumarii]SIS84864.1 hypothetical protein SAMN05421795_10761 [Phaeovulum vinaykumarii]SOC11981.1 hypothetical protein SAMN05878426_10761 [Phaeovulum vinaykumarii]
MDHTFDFGPVSENRIVYVRPVEVDGLPSELRAQAGGLRRIYALHDAEGTRLALVRDRRTAFVLARQNDLAPVNVH